MTINVEKETVENLIKRGFRYYENDLMLIPKIYWDKLPDDTKVFTIDGTESTIGEISDPGKAAWGCYGWGIKKQ